MAVFTNKPKNLATKTLKKHKIYGFFNYIVTSDDVDFKKPDPDGCYKIIKLSSIPPENIIMIGDSELDQKAASLASIKFMHHKVSSSNEIISSKNTKVFKNFNDLID